MLEFVDGGFQFLAINAAGRSAVKPYPLVEDLVRPLLRVGMPRVARLMAAGGAAEELKPSPRKITRLGPNWCPVPFSDGAHHWSRGDAVLALATLAALVSARKP